MSYKKTLETFCCGKQYNFVEKKIPGSISISRVCFAWFYLQDILPILVLQKIR